MRYLSPRVAECPRHARTLAHVSRLGLPFRVSRRTGAILAAGLTLVVVASGWLLYDAASRARDVRSEVYAARAELELAQHTVQALAGLDAGQLPSDDEIRGALDRIRAAHGHLERAEMRLGYLPTLLPIAGVLPPARGASEVPALLDVGLTVTESADRLLTAVLPLLDGATGEGNTDGGPGSEGSLAERVRRVFVEEGDALEAALAQLEATGPEVTRLSARDWGSWLGAAPAALDLLGRSLEEVPRAQEAFAAIRTGLDPLFGFDRPRTYLVAGLNESEIRPTGGFMGTLGIVTVAGGHITTSEFERSYAFEQELETHPPPPDDLRVMMGAGAFLLRDANWWPDFPTSAEATLDRFEANQGYRPDGVIAINTLLTERLVQVFAPIELPEYPETLTTANWRGVMEHTLLEGRRELGALPVAVGSEGGGDSASAEGAYLHPLMEHLIAKSQSVDSEQLPGLLAALATSAAARDLQAYTADPASQAMLDQFGVSGRLEQPTEGERAAGHHRIAVVDSNVSWSKVGPGVRRAITVLLRADGYVDVIVQWRNEVERLDPSVYPRAASSGAVFSAARSAAEPDAGVFGNYLRMYLPSGAEDVEVDGTSRLPRVVDEDGFTVAGGLVVVPRGGTSQVVVSYRLPKATRSLEIWKQGGVEHDSLRVLRNVEGTQHVLFDGPFTSDVRVDVEVQPTVE